MLPVLSHFPKRNSSGFQNTALTPTGGLHRILPVLKLSRPMVVVARGRWHHGDQYEQLGE